MKTQILSGLFGLLLVQSAFAAGTHYEIQVDGLACPFCAYGIEKKLKTIDGASKINVDLDKGVVSVDAAEGKELSEENIKKLFHDSGFTYRGMKKTSL